ncbi:MAG: methylated-DNA--[protein]-cysteine S-methyltransferase [Thermoplasmata archaeon]|nr:methylated-DNA--[protein]-cysteine S-methyltransferase [Thermoplasmata archaeon]
MTVTRVYRSPLGDMLMAADGPALTGLWFEGQAHYAAGLGDAAEGGSPVLDDAEAWLDAYFAGEDPGAPVPVDLRGTEFQGRVWGILMGIPRGTTVTYGWIAGRLSPEAPGPLARAVGGAVGRNPVSIIVPCHRVVGSDGSLTGYAGGTDRKRALLELEGAL